MELKEFNNFGKNILFTGANSGIGFYSLIQLLKKENYLYVPIKSNERRKIFINNLKRHFNDNFLSKYLNIIGDSDFCDLENIYKIRDFLVQKEVLLDILILNAGMQYTGGLYPKVSKQGIEMTFAVNHLAHFLLIQNILSLIKELIYLLNKNELNDLLQKLILFLA